MIRQGEVKHSKTLKGAEIRAETRVGDVNENRDHSRRCKGTRTLELAGRETETERVNRWVCPKMAAGH